MCAQKLSFDYAHTLHTVRIVHNAHSVHETSFSNADNDKYLNRIEGKFGKNLVYAISGSDGSPDDNAEVKQTCIKTLSILMSESDRVV